MLLLLFSEARDEGASRAPGSAAAAVAGQAAENE